MAADLPPLIRCHGVRVSNAKPLLGVWEFHGVCNDRPAYKQIGISSKNMLWYTQDAMEGAMWVVTPEVQSYGSESAPENCVARCRHPSRWPWATKDWEACGKSGNWKRAPYLRFSIVNPCAELQVQLPQPGGGGQVSTMRFRCNGQVYDKPCFRKVKESADPDSEQEVRIFFMPKQGVWLVATLKLDEGGGVEHVLAKSYDDDGASWIDMWPWSVDQGAWELPDRPAVLQETADGGEVTWKVDRLAKVQLSSPPVEIVGSLLFNGVYEPAGMVNGRTYFRQNLENSNFSAAGPVCLWFSEERSQWVLTGPDQLGDARVVRARIASRAWWPWEAHLGGCTAPGVLGATAFAAAPPWQGGAAMLASSITAWEELADADGGLEKAPDMEVRAIFEKKCVFASKLPDSKHAFLGEYKYAGILSSRPFFMCTDPNPLAHRRFCLWYSELAESWVVTADYRLLDIMAADARAEDSAWFPWEISVPWQVADGAGGFLFDKFTYVAAVENSEADIPPTVPEETAEEAAEEEEDVGSPPEAPS
eukprot:TRINITY_DN13403_c0_g1_i2.p1 TRINITY_DN13403_c0_g1~~TRINITY_DN13403_c0_g1_i2.p1  ORF type:complete len:534 (+),score=106.05 TRINITY_DN13403_c0_g1_i2:127-1728(+)